MLLRDETIFLISRGVSSERATHQEDLANALPGF